jgi:hypothetical protein
MPTIHRQVFDFSVRCYTDEDLTEIEDLTAVGETIGAVLGTSFRPGIHLDVEGLVGSFLGLKVGLHDWAGLKGPVIILTAHSQNAKYLKVAPGDQVDIQMVDIGQPIADLLEVELGGGWHPASPEEIKAERIKQDQVVERFRRQEETPWVE